MKLLIVDDSSIIRKSIETAYKNTVFTEIETASDGMLAVTMFEKFLPDVVTLDITMPHMDGLSALTHMLSIKPNTFIITVSALADHHTAIESLNRGAHQFICKPFTPEDLKEGLDQVLETVIQVQAKPVIKDSFQSIHAEESLEDRYSAGYVAPPVIVEKPDISTTVSSASIKVPKPLTPPKRLNIR